MFEFLLALWRKPTTQKATSANCASGEETDKGQTNAQDACLLLKQMTQRTWQKLSPEEANTYVVDCRFAVTPAGAPPHEVLVIAKPLPDVPEYVVRGIGGVILAEGHSLQEVCQDKDVLAVMAGKITVNQFQWRLEGRRRSA